MAWSGVSSKAAEQSAAFGSAEGDIDHPAKLADGLT
jgi:hypothetical protein